jgi:hypothetical protein
VLQSSPDQTTLLFGNDEAEIFLDLNLGDAPAVYSDFWFGQGVLAHEGPVEEVELFVHTEHSRCVLVGAEGTLLAL